MTVGRMNGESGQATPGRVLRVLLVMVAMVLLLGAGQCSLSGGGGPTGGDGGGEPAIVDPRGGKHIPVDELVAAENWRDLVDELEPVIADRDEAAQVRDDAMAAYLLGLAHLAQQGDAQAAATLETLDAEQVLSGLRVSVAFAQIRDEALTEVERALRGP